MKKQHFIILSFIHIALVLTDKVIYNNKPEPDSFRYIAVADELASGSFPDLQPATSCNTAPGYPLFLALIRLFTHNQIFQVIAQSLLFCMSLYLLLMGLREKGWLSLSLCTISASAVLLSPEIIQSNHWVLTEPFCGGLLLLVCACLVKGFSTHKVKFLFVVSTVLLVLSKFEFIVLLPVLLFPLLKTGKIRLAGLTLFVMFVMLLCNGLKNFRIYGKFNLFSFGSGTVIYGGNNHNGDGSWHNVYKTYNYLPASRMKDYEAVHKADDRCACIRQDSLFKEMAWEAWKEDPAAQLKIIPVKLGKLWLIPAGMDFYTGQKEIRTGLQIAMLFDSEKWPWYGKYKHGFYLFVYWVYLLLIILGFWLKIKHQGFGDPDRFMLALVFIVSMLYSIPFYGLGRFHVPVFSLLAVYTSFSIEYLGAKLLFRT